MQVGAADRCGSDPEDDIVVLYQARVGNVFDSNIVGAVVGQRFHGQSLRDGFLDVGQDGPPSSTPLASIHREFVVLKGFVSWQSVITAGCLLALPSAAQETVFYKCTDAAGKVSMQNGTPCAPGMKQEVRRIGEVRSAPLPTRRPEPPAPPPPPRYGEFVLVSGPQMRRQAADPAAADRPAPPPLYQCKTWDEVQYLGEEAEPPPRCAPLQVVGIDGRPAVGIGSACEMKADTCTAVPDGQLCVAWLRRLDEADFRRTHAAAADRADREAAFQRILGQVAPSRCATAQMLEDEAKARP